MGPGFIRLNHLSDGFFFSLLWFGAQKLSAYKSGCVSTQSRAAMLFIRVCTTQQHWELGACCVAPRMAHDNDDDHDDDGDGGDDMVAANTCQWNRWNPRCACVLALVGIRVTLSSASRMVEFICEQVHLPTENLPAFMAIYWK